MLNYRLTNQEQETHITWTRGDSVAVVYSANRLVMEKLDKLCEQHPEVYRCIWIDPQTLGDNLPMGKKYEVPVRYLRFGRPATEAQKAASRGNLAKINSMP